MPLVVLIISTEVRSEIIQLSDLEYFHMPTQTTPNTESS